MAKSTLKNLKDFLEAEPNGTKVPLAELKELSPEDREDLLTELDKVS